MGEQEIQVAEVRIGHNQAGSGKECDPPVEGRNRSAGGEKRETK